MKKCLFLFAFLVCVAAYGEESIYPWTLTLFGGGALLCDEQGCFGPSGLALGASFGRQFTPHWSFELEGTYVRANQLEAPRLDLFTGLIFVPELQRSRVWGGATFFRPVGHIGGAELFIALGGVGAYERTSEKVPAGVTPLPTNVLGVKGGISAGAGFNIWLTPHWGIRPEARFYAVATPLSGFRYTGGLIHKF